MKYIFLFFIFFIFSCKQDKPQVSNKSENANSNHYELKEGDAELMKELGYTHYTSKGFLFRYINDVEGNRINQGDYLMTQLILKEGDSIVRRSTDLRPYMLTQAFKINPNDNIDKMSAPLDVCFEINSGDVVAISAVTLDSLRFLKKNNMAMDKLESWQLKLLNNFSSQDYDRISSQKKSLSDSIRRIGQLRLPYLNEQCLLFGNSLIGNAAPNAAIPKEKILSLPITGAKLYFLKDSIGPNLKKDQWVKSLVFTVNLDGKVMLNDFGSGNYQEFIIGLSKLNPAANEAVEKLSVGDEALIFIPSILAMDNYRHSKPSKDNEDLVMYIQIISSLASTDQKNYKL